MDDLPMVGEAGQPFGAFSVYLGTGTTLLRQHFYNGFSCKASPTVDP